MEMEQQKILFADLYRLLGGIKDETKTLGKEGQNLLSAFADWESVTMCVNSIVSEAELIRSMAHAMIQNCDIFLRNGPYTGQSVGMLPLEFMEGNADADHA